MFVIGTAGHVDHGKSTLVLALTGIDPDRWEEEKRRGLTIDLGFAWLRLPSGDEVSIVDVPGHERFIKNMLAGVGGIDLALLVIAADEGVMPQTREHLAIIDLLGIERGVVALTKSDLVAPDAAAVARLDAEELLAGTALVEAPIVPCSAATGFGIDEVVAALSAELARVGRRKDIGRPRLPVDRAFTMTGFGTVVTGTLIDGSLRVGDEGEVLPGGKRARIRGLQTHGESAEIAPPGRRTAVNLAGVAVDDLRRGMVLAAPGTVKPTTAVDVRLRAVPYLARPVRHNLNVTFHTGAAEAEGKLLLLDADEVPPGGEAWGQIRLAEPVVALVGDRYIVRDPNDTLGGGPIVATDATRHRRFDAETIARLVSLAEGSPQAALVAAIASAHRRHEAAVAQLTETLTAYHEQSPLRPGMPREELRRRLGLVGDAFDALLTNVAGSGLIARPGRTVALASHNPAVSPSEQARADAYLKALRASPYAPPTDLAPDDELQAYLEARGDVVRAGGDVVFAADAYDAMVARLTEHLRANRTVTLAQVRDMFGTTRKYAQALLEHLDASRVTRRVGDERVLR